MNLQKGDSQQKNSNKKVTPSELRQFLENTARLYGVFILTPELYNCYHELCKEWLHPEWTKIFSDLLKDITKKNRYRYLDDDSKKYFVSVPLTHSDKNINIVFEPLTGKEKGRYRIYSVVYTPKTDFQPPSRY